MKFAGLELKNPMVVASGPVTAKLWQLQEAEQHGAAAVSIKHVMNKQSFRGNMRCYSDPGEVMIFPIDRRLDVEEGLKLIEDAKKRTSLAIMVNFSNELTDIEEYGRMAKAFENAGADALEINMCCPNFSLGNRDLGIDPDQIDAGAITGQNPQLAGAITKIVKNSVNIPVIPKLTPTALDIVKVAKACEAAGADGLSLVGGPSIAAPPVDIYQGGRPLYALMDKTAYGAITGSAIRYATFKVTGQVAAEVSIPIVSSGGIDTWEHAIQMMMWGASAVALCTAVMWEGFGVIEEIHRGMETFLESQGYSSYDEIVGKSLEYISPNKEMELLSGSAIVDEDTCTGCERCLRVGHCDAIVMQEAYANVISEKCIGCGVCVSVCPFDSISMIEFAGR
ncbi:MAG TPA: hypothetical protein DDZ66_01460 [Firmicutes bacterium]|jgi:dihydroorotate dehydrogenase subfamily 1|nr:hypothetical protein [Bacillota bacterium]